MTSSRAERKRKALEITLSPVARRKLDGMARKHPDRNTVGAT